MTEHIQSFAPVFADAFGALAAQVELQRSGESPATGYAPLGQLLESLGIERWIDEGGMDASSFGEFFEGYLAHSVQLHHPLHAAHQVSVPDVPPALTAMADALLNNPMGIYEMGPAAAAIEYAVINWMLRKVGWREQPLRPLPDEHYSAGALTHGGSLANLTALLAARATCAPDAWVEGVPDNLVIMVSPVAHYSVARSVAMLGLGERAIAPLPADPLGRVRPEKLAEAVGAQRDAGKTVMAVIANACATATGLHDPVREMGEVCRAGGVWFHVDACHGASALLHPELRSLMAGIELADSIVWDAHKMLQVPALCAAVLFRDHTSFDRAFSQDASYLAYDRDEDSHDALMRVVECTKAPIGVRLFMNLAWRGEVALGQFVADRYAMAKMAHAMITERDGFSCPYEPETNILCFRVEGDDALQTRIRDAMVRERTAHITTATVAGQTWLRFTLMNPLTDASAVASILDLIEQTAARLRR